jgi:hypothetical protein
MSGISVTAYATEIATVLGDAVGPPISFATQLLIDAADGLDTQLQGGPAVTPATWSAATAKWTNAQRALGSHLQTYLRAGLPCLPGLNELVRDAKWNSPEGLNGELELGPLTLSFASSALIVRPPAEAGVTEPLVLGPFRPNSIAAKLAGVAPGAIPGGGTLVRLRDGFGGAMQVPLAIASVNATALLQGLSDGTSSFLGVMGVQFSPPIQLSFGFALDRVGGLVGINRRADIDALGRAVRTGAAGDLLFASGQPDVSAALVGTANTLFPPRSGHHLIGPTLTLSWLSSGAEGSLVGANLAVVVEVPTAKVVLVGMAEVGIPRLPELLHLRLDMTGVVDPLQELVSIDASLVDSRALGAFTLFGDAAMRTSWGSQAYSVLSIGGFYPGYQPEPARLPALRRVGMRIEQPVPGISIRADGYLAITTNTVQLGAGLDVRIGANEFNASGGLHFDALLQFRPFRFEAGAWGGFRVSVADVTVGGVRLDGNLAGPGPLTLHGRMTIETPFDDISWSDTFKISGGSPDVMETAEALITVVEKELENAKNIHAEGTSDPDVILKPAPSEKAAVPPTGSLRFEQGRVPLGVYVDRVDGRPLPGRQRVQLMTAGTAVTASFAPGGYLNLSKSEMLSKPTFDTLPAGIIPNPTAEPGTADTPVDLVGAIIQIIILNGKQVEPPIPGITVELAAIIRLVSASQSPPTLGDQTRSVIAKPTSWQSVSPGGAVENHASATAAFQMAKHHGGFAVAAGELSQPVDLSTV